MKLKDALEIKRGVTEMALESAMKHIDEEAAEMMAWLFWIDQAVKAQATINAIERIMEDYC